jgi:hypothetical protein
LEEEGGLGTGRTCGSWTSAGGEGAHATVEECLEGVLGDESWIFWFDLGQPTN